MIADLHVDPIIQRFLFEYDVSRGHSQTWQAGKRRWIFAAVQQFGRWQKLHRPFVNHIDLPRMQKGGYAFGAFGIHSWPLQSEYCWRLTLRQLDYFKHLSGESTSLSLARDPAEAVRISQAGGISAFPAIEGAHCLGRAGRDTQQQRLRRLERLRDEYGVGYLTLVHFSRNDVATPSMGLGRNDKNGLTAFGKEIIRQMNSLGMMVDLAHLNTQGVLDACRVSNKPVIISHTCLKSVNNHRRNINDEALQAVADTGGVVGIMLAANFMAPPAQYPTSAKAVEHIDYIVQTVGEDHAAIGSDFDGWILGIPSDMHDATSLPLLARKMKNLNYSEKRIAKVMSGNFFRVWQDAIE